MEEIGEFTYKDEYFTVHQSHYADGTTAIVLRTPNSIEGPEYGKLSVSVGKAILGEDEFVVNHDIDDELLKFLLTQTDLFEDTGRRVGYGYVAGAPILKIK